MNTKNKINFGIVGCGYVANTHAEILSSFKQTRLECVCDIDENKMKHFSEKFNVEKKYTDYEKMLNENIDAVIISTPNWFHSEMAIKVAKAGKHVLLEKPIALSLKDGEKVVRECKNHQVMLSVVHQYRFCPPALKLKELINVGKLGKLITGFGSVIWKRDEKYFEESPWRGEKLMAGGGTLLHQSIHVVDLLQWYFGPYNEVSAFTNTLVHETEVEDTATSLIRFQNGSSVALACTTASPVNRPASICVIGSRGIVQIEDFKQGGIVTSHGIDREIFHTSYPVFNSRNVIPVYARNHAAQIMNFISAIEGREKLLVDGEEAMKSLEIILRMYNLSGIHGR